VTSRRPDADLPALDDRTRMSLSDIVRLGLLAPLSRFSHDPFVLLLLPLSPFCNDHSFWSRLPDGAHRGCLTESLACFHLEVVSVVITMSGGGRLGEEEEPTDVLIVRCVSPARDIGIVVWRTLLLRFFSPNLFRRNYR
jgi:hypothetical protein